MADEVHVHSTQPAGKGGGGGSAGWVVAGLVIVVLVVLLWFVFGRGNTDTVVPDEIELDVNIQDSR